MPERAVHQVANRQPQAASASGHHALRQAFSSFATGVTVVTVCDTLGRPRGMTANSFTSVSLAPPLILICVATQAPIWPAFAGAPTFAVNVLAAGQRELSQRFARPADDKFAGIGWQHGELGVPLIDGAAAHLECRRVREIEAGDHMILLGEVVHFAHSPAPPLVFHRGAYAALAQ
ncbi:flavin reductase family protein [Dongia sp.]|uniref:flavin reductase family protein n=1 Tax=Dongia sp. TaxID=1977262 RepID=UPI0035AEFA85